MRWTIARILVAAAIVATGCTNDAPPARTAGGSAADNSGGSRGSGGGGADASLSLGSGGVIAASGSSATAALLGTGGSQGTGGQADAGLVGGDDGGPNHLDAGDSGGTAPILPTGGSTAMGGHSGMGGSADAGVAKVDSNSSKDGAGTLDGKSDHVGGATATGGHSGTAGSTDAGAPRASGGTVGSGDAGAQAPGGQITGYGFVAFTANSKNLMVRLQTTLTVPAEPPASGTLFLWPGLQPGGANYLPIDNGVLQPVLTWGRSCAPGTQPKAYSTWWISAQYVNSYGKDPGYTGCSGGSVMPVNVGDTLDIDMQLAGQVWNQTVTDVQTGQSVNFSKDMLGQTQNHAYFDIEEYSSAPVSPVVFTNTILTFGAADAADCRLAKRGQTDFVSVPQLSSDSLQCFVQEIILRAKGIQ